jgi:hydrogenase maturation factor
MCQAFVGRVVKVNGDKITIDYKGNAMELNSKLVKVKEGDSVLFSADIAMEKIDEEEAELIRGDIK